MKNNLLIVMMILLFASCQNQKAEMAMLKARNDSLEIVAAQSDKNLMEYISSFNEIQDNLDKIKEAEHIVTINSSDPELQQSGKDQIIDDINTIYELMEKNKSTIAELDKKLKRSGNKNKELEKLIATLKQQLVEKDAEIAALNTKLAALNIQIDVLGKSIDTLHNELNKKDRIISDQTVEINTGYFVFGTEKELKEQKILTKQGGFAGLGKSLKLDNDFSTTYFTKIDIRSFDELPLEVKSARLVTNHPSNSYEFVGEKKHVQSIRILDKKAFWKNSKYLVIVVDL